MTDLLYKGFNIILALSSFSLKRFFSMISLETPVYFRCFSFLLSFISYIHRSVNCAISVKSRVQYPLVSMAVCRPFSFDSRIYRIWREYSKKNTSDTFHPSGAYYDNVLLGGCFLEKIFVCGGDLRSEFIADYFRSVGKKVYVYGSGSDNDELSKVEECSSVILGLPAVKGKNVYMPRSSEVLGYDTLIRAVPRGAYLFGGRLTEDFVCMAKSRGIGAYDYSEDEIFQTENALYTAEGAVCSIIENTDISLNGMKILIIGGGRISKALCALLGSAPCRIDVYARRELQRTFFAMRGHRVTGNLGNFYDYDVIVNTVPGDIFSESLMREIKKDSLVMDLSARPGYVPVDICKKLGLKLLYLPGIPLTSAPRSAGIAAARAIERIALTTNAKGSGGC